jgi:hypothetical protein
MSRFCDFARNDFLQCVDALARGVEGVHEMHFVGFFAYDEKGVWSVGWLEKAGSLLDHHRSDLQ